MKKLYQAGPGSQRQWGMVPSLNRQSRGRTWIGEKRKLPESTAGHDPPTEYERSRFPNSNANHTGSPYQPQLSDQLTRWHALSLHGFVACK